MRIERHPAEKDATDLELALDVALAMSPRRILVLAGERRPARPPARDAAPPRLGPLRERARSTRSSAMRRVHVVRGERALEGEPGELLSLLALHGPAEGVTTEGLAYPLRGETLEPGSSRGVSNVFAADDGARLASSAASCSPSGRERAT